jgi:hypothetical protein
VRAACDFLASGEDGYSLAMLAGLPLRAPDEREVEDLIEPALAEVGLAYRPPRSREADESDLAVMARCTVSGSVSPRELASWTHRAFGHDGLPLAARLSEFDDIYDRANTPSIWTSIRPTGVAVSKGSVADLNETPAVSISSKMDTRPRRERDSRSTR